MSLKLTAIREENLLPVSSLEAIKGGAVVTSCSTNSCDTFLGGDCKKNTCGKHYGECDDNNCTLNQGDCGCMFVVIQPSCPGKCWENLSCIKYIA